MCIIYFKKKLKGEAKGAGALQPTGQKAQE